MSDRAVAYSERVAKEQGATEMILHAPESVIGFYETLGYCTYGPRFDEVGLPHHAMKKALRSQPIS